MASDKPWDFSPSDYDPAQWRRACLLDRGTGGSDSKERYSLPVRDPSGALNSDGVSAAAGRLDQVPGISPGQRASLARTLVQLYGECNMDVPNHLKEMAGDSMSQRAADLAAIGEVAPVDATGARAPIEERSAALRNVDFGERILTVVAVPYEQPTPVEYRGEVWREVFSRSAFNGFEPAKRRVPVSAVLRAPAFDHKDGHLVGKVANVYPEKGEGLVLDMRISQIPAGDEALQLAQDGVLAPSIGFAARAGDHQLDRRSMVRRVNRAFLDHVSMVPTPAYDGARVLAMRDAGPPVSARNLPPLITPSLDDFYSDPLMQWADERLGGK